MFYSHQLLARKAPLGQIRVAWSILQQIRLLITYAFSFHRSEEILNPSVPMALRLSGILMDDVNRFLVEINRAYMAKSGGDHSTSKIQAKGRAQARSSS
ncbi:Sister chromatid cohesion 1 protein 1 [Apostasia shenzhenica]|uniref:Sister chromatid cohesion 1 protein 1 n=1 Tax=Apostasia shenzhenica TaxID=1088818 RepID=A0A2I0BHJ1_9ASPA|nr:Sister chromatid cohesion 1 protein 1 [Apostasia shenzhenica]